MFVEDCGQKILNRSKTSIIICKILFQSCSYKDGSWTKLFPRMVPITLGLMWHLFWFFTNLWVFLSEAHVFSKNVGEKLTCKKVCCFFLLLWEQAFHIKWIGSMKSQLFSLYDDALLFWQFARLKSCSETQSYKIDAPRTKVIWHQHGREGWRQHWHWHWCSAGRIFDIEGYFHFWSVLVTFGFILLLTIVTIISSGWYPIVMFLGIGEDTSL